jgi:HSP20 family protein
MTSLIRFPRHDLYASPLLGSLLDEFFQDTLPHGQHETTFRVDVFEEENAYIIEADLPGVKKEEITLDLEDDLVTISVKREEPQVTEAYLHRERTISDMVRTLRLPQSIGEGTTANYDNGVLKISLPKLSVGKRNTAIEVG